MTYERVPDRLYRKSSYSQPTSNNCVEVADVPGASSVRDSQHRHLGSLVFEAVEWAVFVKAVKADELA
ncbi:hypothetical protein GCM10009799_06400 [Nocardiopsis rhodophaea]|uniref:DUF397 domain-containing protein n=1 Tax=Nocardiopsis rhodophaea TaxID=280238 RepID=A0ABP5DSQ9_9ACTN